MRGARFKLAPNDGQEGTLVDMAGARRLAYNSALELIDELYQFKVGSDPQISEAMIDGGYVPWRYLDPFTLNNINKIIRNSGVYGNPKRVPTTVVEEAVVDACKAHHRWVEYITTKKGRKVGKPQPAKYDPDGSTFRIRKGAVTALETKDAIKLPTIKEPIAVVGLTRWLKRQLKQTDGSVRLVTVKREHGSWFASVVVEREQLEPDKIKTVMDLDDVRSGGVIPFELRPDVVGGDLGLTTLLTLSDGRVFENPRFLGRSKLRLRAISKAVSRAERRRYLKCWRLAVEHDPVKWTKEAELLRLNPATGKGLPVPPAYWRSQVPRSRNLLVLLDKLNRLHRHITAQRKANAQIVASQIGRDYAALGLETLNITGMMANSHLARSIADAGWRDLTSAIESSIVDHGGLPIRHNTFYPSTQLCSGFLADDTKCPGRMKLKLSTRIYECEICGLVIGRDLNASINLRPSRDQVATAISAREAVAIAYNKKISDRAKKAKKAGKTIAAKARAKAATQEPATTAENVVNVDRMTRETQNWSGERTANRSDVSPTVRRFLDVAIATGSGRTSLGVPTDSAFAEPTG
jgi:putative transposase